MPGALRAWKKLVLGVAVMLLLALAVQQKWLEHLSDSHWVAEYVRQSGPVALLWLSFSGVVFTAAGGPRQLLAFVFGYTLGAWSGALLATLVTGIGAALCFMVARTMLRESVQQRFGGALQRLQRLFRERTASTILVIRLLPVGSNLVTNILAGSTDARLLPFVCGSLIGYLPQMLVFGLLGSGIGVSDHQQLFLSAGLFLIASLVGVHLYRTADCRELGELVTEKR